MTYPIGPPYDWDTLPATARDALRSFVTHAAAVLDGNFVGLYLHGSLGRGCYHPAFSDVDLLVVTHGACGDDSIATLAAHRLPLDLHIHAVGVTRDQLRGDEVPTPAEFELQTDSGGDHALVGRRVRSGRGDLLLVRQDSYDCNTALAGAPVREVVRPVLWRALAASCDELLPHLVPHFKNPVLMLCRVCYAFAHRALCSKVTAGEWAAQTFGAEWQQVIESALVKYHDGLPDNTGETPELRAFERYCLTLINTLRPVGGPQGHDAI